MPPALRSRLRLRANRIAYAAGLILTLAGLATAYVTDGKAAFTPGALSKGHGALTDECQRCHTLEFPEARAMLGTNPARAMNAACLDCHAASMGYDKIYLHATHGKGRAGVEDQACADCHVQHDAVELTAVVQPRCVSCHLEADPPIGRFGERAGAGDHPDFAPEPGSDSATLRFDHQRHLKIGRTHCLDCHGGDAAERPKARGRYMAPAQYPSACQHCHPLVVDIDGHTFDVEHGQNAVSQDSLRVQARAAGVSRDRTELAIAAMYSAEGTCGYCHQIESAPDGPRVARAEVRRRWYANADFDHRQHIAVGYKVGDTKPQTECRHCHSSVLTSTRAADVSVPGIDNCRQCHGRGAGDDCATCHAFHAPPRTGPLDYHEATPEQIASGREETRFGMRDASPQWPIRTFFELPEKVWKRPDIKPRSPEFYAEVFRRYGLFEADFDNDGLPLGLVRTEELYEGEPAMAVTCEFCHSSSLFGKIVRGQPNRFSTMKVWFYEMNLTTTQRIDPLYGLGVEDNTVVNAADQLGLIGLVIRQPDLALDVPLALAVADGEAMHLKPEFDALAFIKTPPWYTYRTKASGTADYYFDGGYPKDGNFSAFTYVAAFLRPDGAKIRERLSAWQFGGHEYLSSLHDRAPAYPFPIDEARVPRGRAVYDEHCSKCHGRYTDVPAAADNLVYPGLVVDLDKIGTDPLRANFPAKFAERTRKILRDDFYPARGYVAPPLTAIWARAPYLHNGAVPTIRSLLSPPDQRPRRWALLADPNRKQDYDTENLGWRYRALRADEEITHNRIHDSDVMDGLLNGGHEYGIDLAPEVKEDLLAFLRTL